MPPVRARYRHRSPGPGLSRFFGKAYRETYLLRFNYIRMASWEQAATAAEVVSSNLTSELTLCSDCWGDVLSFANKPIVRRP